MNNLISNFIPQEHFENDNAESIDTVCTENETEREQDEEENDILEEQINDQDSGNSDSMDNNTPLVSSENILNKEEITKLIQFYEVVKSGEAADEDITQSNELKKLDKSLRDLRNALSANSQTAKLWLQYIDYVQLMKLFIRAERTGNWKLHLVAIKRMINLFAATGHMNYAKSARLYLQFMLNLPEEHPWLHSCFIEKGCHTIRRRDR